MRLSYRARTWSTWPSSALALLLVLPFALLGIACSSSSLDSGPGPGCTPPDGGFMGQSGTEGGPGDMPEGGDGGLSGHSGSEGGPAGNLPEGGLSGHSSNSSDGGC